MDGIRKRIFSKSHETSLPLGEIAKVYQPPTISASELIESGYPVFGANGIMGYYSQYNHKSEQICITCRGNTCGTVNFTLPFSWITGNSMVVNVDDNTNISKRYLYHFLNTVNYSRIISGSGQPQIIREPLLKILIPVPVFETQEAIAKALDCLVEQVKVSEALRKKYIYQKLFILSNMFI